MPAQVESSKRDLRRLLASEISSEKATDVVQSLDRIVVKGQQFVRKPKDGKPKEPAQPAKQPAPPKPPKKK